MATWVSWPLEEMIISLFMQGTPHVPASAHHDDRQEADERERQDEGQHANW
jgi:hypothetical protein